MTPEQRDDWLGWAVDVVGRLSIAAIVVLIAATFVSWMVLSVILPKTLGTSPICQC